MRGTRWATIASSSAAVVTTCEVSSSGSDASSGTPARWTTASRRSSAKTAATASASAQSASCHANVVPSGAGTRSSPTTSWPQLGEPDRDAHGRCCPRRR